jgi:hypothetical protein
MITTNRKSDYVLNTVEGAVTIRELLGYAQQNVDTWLSDPVLWDLTNATLKEDKSDYAAIRRIVSGTHQDLAKVKEHW